MQDTNTLLYCPTLHKRFRQPTRVQVRGVSEDSDDRHEDGVERMSASVRGGHLVLGFLDIGRSDGS